MLSDILENLFGWLTPKLTVDHGYVDRVVLGKHLRLKVRTLDSTFGVFDTSSDDFKKVNGFFPSCVGDKIAYYNTLTDEELAKVHGLVRDTSKQFGYFQPFYWTKFGIMNNYTGRYDTKFCINGDDGLYNSVSTTGGFCGVYA